VYIISKINAKINSINETNSVSEICVKYGYCVAPFAPHSDPVPLPKYVVNLDLEPELRRKRFRYILLIFGSKGNLFYPFVPKYDPILG
jgi:hypothetical protein